MRMEWGKKDILINASSKRLLNRRVINILKFQRFGLADLFFDANRFSNNI